jgi:hypothetical protein
MYYIGSRQSNCDPKDDLGVKYFSSSSNENFINEQKKNPSRFKYEILSLHNSRMEAFDEEIRVQIELDCLNDEMCYNKSINHLNFTNYSKTFKCTKETKEKISKARKEFYKTHDIWNKGYRYPEEFGEKVSESLKGNPKLRAQLGKKLSVEVKEKISESVKEYFKTHDNARKGSHWSEEDKKHQSKLRKGKTWEELYGIEKALEMREHLSKSTKGENNGMFGKKQPEEAKKKISEKRRGKKRSEEDIRKQKETVKNKPFVTCPYCGLRAKQSPNMTRYHFENCKFRKGIK